ncbi:hypothetical protein AcV5_008079 [Taiwanofungus camphoratus]|nr:hypothetical protein AcV5_008079 [Antrodia cinnamomea]
MKTAPFTLFLFFAPPTSCFERLTQLYLCNLCYDQLRHLDTFFDFIEATPNLETLDLNEASQFPRPNEVSVFPLQRRLALPRLRTLCFHGCRWEAIAWVLRHFTFSGSVSIYAEVNSLTYLTDMGAVFQEDAAFLSHLRALTKLDVWAIANKLCMSCSGVALELCFIWNGYIVDGDIRGVNSMFMGLLPRILHLIDVTELRMKIGGKYLPYIYSIQDLFQDLPAVESCTIELGLEKDKAQYWHACLVEGEVEGNVPFTHLQALHFIGEPDLLEDVIWMLRLARRRAGVGRRLRKLICPVPRSASAGAWNPDRIRVDGEHVVAFVDSVEWNATPPMMDIRGWDSVI